MKPIRKKYKCEDKIDQKLYVEKFDNYQDLIKTINDRQPEAANKMRNIDMGSWTGVDDWKKANDLLQNGWEAPVKEINKRFDNAMNKTIEKRRMAQFANVQGFCPIVPNALRNLPNSMIDLKRDVKKTKILNFLIIIDRACRNSTDEIEKKMVEQLSAIAKLERDDGYRCRISVLATFCSGTPKSGTNIAGIVKVKDESQPFDIKRLSFPIVHAAMLRAFMFAWEGTVNAKDALNCDYGEYHESGLGKSFEYWDESRRKEFSDAVTDVNEKTIVLHFYSDVEKEINGIKKGGDRK